MADGPVFLPITEWDRASAERRIVQLESALARRGDQLEDAHSALDSIRESRTFRLAELMCKVTNKLLPLHSRRRRVIRTLSRATMRKVREATGRNLANLAAGGEGVSVALDQLQFARWIERHEPDSAQIARQRRRTFARRPKISIVVPTYNTPESFLREMIESVFRQTYTNWQLCVADGGSTAPHLRAILNSYDDPRLVVRFLDSNLGIAGNTNAAIALGNGEYIAFLDHDDTLAPWALHEIVSRINRTPAVDFIYSDEDKLDEAGQRVDPVFKPDWSPDLLRNHNYVCHLLALKRSLVDELGGLRDGFDGAQDYDLVLRAGERAACIVHLPQILYHWRLHRHSTAAKVSSKSYLVEAGRAALCEHLSRSGCHATASPGDKPGTYRVRYHLARQPLVSVIVPNRDSVELLSRCVESLERSDYANYELLILENGSDQSETRDYYKTLGNKSYVRLLEWRRPFNFSAINNFGAAHARGEVLLFLNNDVEAIDSNWLESMVAQAMRPEIGAVGAKLLFADGSIQHAGVVLGLGGAAGHSHLRFPRDSAGYLDQLRHVTNVSAVTGACLMTRRNVFQRVGGFDERFVLAYNDVDYGMLVRACGFRVLWTPEAQLYHLESKTRGYEDDPVKYERFRREFNLFRRKWAKELAAGDPYYNPNFRLDRSDFALRA